MRLTTRRSTTRDDAWCFVRFPLDQRGPVSGSRPSSAPSRRLSGSPADRDAKPNSRVPEHADRVRDSIPEVPLSPARARTRPLGCGSVSRTCLRHSTTGAHSPGRVEGGAGRVESRCGVERHRCSSAVCHVSLTPTPELVRGARPVGRRGPRDRVFDGRSGGRWRPVLGACDGYVVYVEDALEITRLRHSPKPSSATSKTPRTGLEICAAR
jgi:hypothetical protein